MTAFKTIVFDFDGTLVESVGIKDQAFVYLFSGFPEQFPAIMDYHLAHNAVIRFDKFKHIYEEILKQEFNETIQQDLSQRYSRFVKERVIACPAVEGSQEFLTIFAQRVPLYLLSVNPLEELKDILNARGLQDYFKDIYAHPWLKPEALREIIRLEGCRPEECLFIGDTPEDCTSAQRACVPFIGRDSGKFNADFDRPCFKNFLDLSHYLEKRRAG